MKKIFKRPKKIKLKFKLFGSFAIILVLPIIVVGFLSYSSAQEQLKKELLFSAEQNVAILDNIINNEISPKQHDTETFAKNITANQVGNGNTEIIKPFDQYMELHPEVQSMFIGTKDGQMISSPDLNLPSDFDPRERSWYLGAEEKKGELIITSPYPAAGSGDMVVTIAKTLDDGSGVIGIAVYIELLQKTAEEVQIGKEGYAILLDAEQKYITSPINEAGEEAKDALSNKLYEQASGHLSDEHGGQAKQVYFTTNKLTGWKVAGTMSDSEVSEATRPLLINTLIVIALSILIGAGAITFIVLSITRRIRDLQQKAKKISEGDLTEIITIKVEDEIGDLAGSFNDMIVSIRGLLKTIESNSEQVAASAEELTASAEQTSQANGQVATAILEVASSAEKQTYGIDNNVNALEEISQGAALIARNSLTVTNLTRETTLKAEEGGKSVLQTVDQMSSIHHSVIESNTMIKSLSNRSKEIESILDVITGISNQTNLLALNAAIEAARAGEAGKGFAVVADEVRKLAEQSQVSAQQISELIQAIQQDTENTVSKMSKVTEDVQSGLVVSEDAVKNFFEILDSMKEITPQMESVSATAELMSVGVQKAGVTANEIADIAKSNATTSEEVAASTEEQLASMEEIALSAKSLSKLAEELQEGIQKFKY